MAHKIKCSTSLIIKITMTPSQYISPLQSSTATLEMEIGRIVVQGQPRQKCKILPEK
jgi:hypothetical protein